MTPARYAGTDAATDHLTREEPMTDIVPAHSLEPAWLVTATYAPDAEETSRPRA
jgi:hypothetical protein